MSDFRNFANGAEDAFWQLFTDYSSDLGNHNMVDSGAEPWWMMAQVSDHPAGDLLEQRSGIDSVIRTVIANSPLGEPAYPLPG